jgi:hypothetical protein
MLIAVMDVVKKLTKCSEDCIGELVQTISVYNSYERVTIYHRKLSRVESVIVISS